MLRSVAEYQLEGDAAAQLFNWFRKVLVNFQQGKRTTWLTMLWAMYWDAEGQRPLLDQASQRVLRQPRADPNEFDAARAVRLRLMVAERTTETERNTQ